MPLFGAPGERVGYELYPHPDGAPPLVLVHGFTASKSSFEVNLIGLREHFTVVTVELLGHGDSEAPDDPIFYRPERAVRRILQLIDHLGYNRVLLCGHSLGGALALRLTLDAPEWVAGLVVINSSSAAGDPNWREEAAPRMQEMGERVREQGTAFMKQTRLYPAHSKRLDPLSRELLTRDFDRLQPAGVAGTAQSLVVDVNAWERHPQLAVPFLMVVGERDGDFAPNATPFLARFPQHLVHEVRLPQAGHAANIEQPREFEQAVVSFAREIAYLREPRTENNRVLMALGGALVFAGLGLLGAAVLFNGGDDGGDTDLLAAAPATETVRPTQLAQVAGTVASGPSTSPTRQPAVPNVSPAASASPGTSPTAAAPTTAPSTPTKAPANTPAPTATSQPEPTPVPTAAGTATATSTPVGAWATLSGPSTAEVGSAIVVYGNAGPGSPRLDITLPSGTTLTHSGGGASWVPSQPGCYTFTLTAYLPTGQRTASHSVSVGGVSCSSGQG